MSGADRDGFSKYHGDAVYFWRSAQVVGGAEGGIKREKRKEEDQRGGSVL